MATNTTVKVEGVDEVNTLLAQLPDHSLTVAKDALRITLLDARDKVLGNFERYSKSNFIGGDNLRTRSGQLKASIKTSVRGTKLSALSGSFYSTSPTAPIHEFGGTVEAKKAYATVPGGPYMNIPLPSNLSSNGIQLQSPAQVFSSGGRIIKSKLNNFLVVSKQGLLMFVLKKSVYIKPRLGMVKAAEDEIPTLLGVLREELLRGL